MYTPAQIGNWFMKNTDFEAGSYITPLKLQKLLYYVQAWGLALYNERVIDANFEAWAHGPVIRDVYFALSEYGYQPIVVDDAYFEESNIDLRTENLLEQIRDIYGIYDGKYLEKLTHQEQPWLEARNGLSPEAKSNKIISEETMKNYYLEMQNQ